MVPIGISSCRYFKDNDDHWLVFNILLIIDVVVSDDGNDIWYGELSTQFCCPVT